MHFTASVILNRSSFFYRYRYDKGELNILHNNINWRAYFLTFYVPFDFTAPIVVAFLCVPFPMRVSIDKYCSRGNYFDAMALSIGEFYKKRIPWEIDEKNWL